VSQIEPGSESSESGAPREKQPRGFARMPAERQREIASIGGKTAHQSGRAHQFSSEEGRRAGQKGGASISRDREYMRRLGKKGGLARALRLSAPATDELQAYNVS
jgi:general stress protein YciG